MESTPQPLITIVTPVLNGMPYMEGCLDSVMAQGYPLIEHLVMDGGSTDGTVELLAKYAAQYPNRLRYVSEPDRGCGDAWVKGVKAARGQILGCVGADDLVEPGAIDAVAAFFIAHPDAKFVHGGCRQISDDGTVIDHRPEPFNYREFVGTARHIATPSAYCRRELLNQIGALEECGNDFELMLRIARTVPVHHVEATLSTLRRRVGTAFNSSDAVTRAKTFRDDYLASRRNGGSLTSPIALRYFWAAIAARLGIQPTSTMGRAVSGATRALRDLS